MGGDLNGVPSLKNCTKLVIKGEVDFAAGVVCEGSCEFVNAGEGKKTVAAGSYKDYAIPYM